MRVFRRVVVATQHGVLHTFPNDQAAKKTKVFLDIQDRVRYNDNTNEEGFLGLAFHPMYKANGQFFVFYSVTPRGSVAGDRYNAQMMANVNV